MDYSSEKSFDFKSPRRQSRVGALPVTPSRRGKLCRTTTPDRFIPSRAVNNFSVSQHLLSTSERRRREKLTRAPLSTDQSACLSPAQRESQRAYQEGLTAAFGSDVSNRVLSFRVKPFQSADGEDQLQLLVTPVVLQWSSARPSDHRLRRNMEGLTGDTITLWCC